MTMRRGYRAGQVRYRSRWTRRAYFRAYLASNYTLWRIMRELNNGI